MGKTSIEWTRGDDGSPGYTWNPTTGCSKVSAGCVNCYAEAVSTRWGHTTKPWTHPYAAENVVLHPERLDQPLRWRKPRRIFVDSMSDLFHEQVPDGFIAWVWQIMAKCPQHTFQVLTKRPERMRSFVERWNDLSGETDAFKGARGPEETREAHPSGRGQLFAAYLEELGKTNGGQPPEGAAWPTFDWMEGSRWWPTTPLPNVWLGTSLEDQRVADRVLELVQTPAVVRFLSCEPLIGPLDLTRIPVIEGTDEQGTFGVYHNALTGHYQGPDDIIEDHRIHWVIVGGESGPKHRPIDPEWVRSLRDQCTDAGVAFFFKQWGGRFPKQGGRELDGREWSQFPDGAGGILEEVQP